MRVRIRAPRRQATVPSACLLSVFVRLLAFFLTVLPGIQPWSSRFLVLLSNWSTVGSSVKVPSPPVESA